MRAIVRFVGAVTFVAYAMLSAADSARAASALDLGPSNAYVTFGAAPTLGLAQFTVETWFKREGTGVTTSTGTGGIAALVPLVSKGAAQAEGSNVDANYILGINTAGNVIAADFEEGVGGTSLGLNHPISGVTPIVNGLWYHAAATYDGTTWRLYLNGVLENQLVVGQPTAIRQHSARGSRYDDDVDRCRVGLFRRRARRSTNLELGAPATQIRSTMNQGLTSGTGLVARWGLDEGYRHRRERLRRARRKRDDNRHGSTWVANAPFDIAPCANNAGAMLRFDGTNDYVTFGTSSELGLSQFTIETWFKREGTGVSNTTGSGGVTVVPLIAKGAAEADGSNVDANYILGINTTGNVLAADFEDAATGLNHPISGTTAIVNNVWYHAAATYNGTTWSLYLNGNLEATLVVGAFTPRSDSIQPAGIATMQKSALSPGQLGFFAGLMDEVRIWSFARSQAQIQADQYSELTSGAGLVARWGLSEGTGTTTADSVGAPASNGTLTNGPVWVNTGASVFVTDGACDDGEFCNGADTCNGAAGGLRCAINAGDPCVGGSECADTCDEANDSCNNLAGTACGSPANSVCDNPDTCDGAGNCDVNNEPITTVCNPAAGACDLAEFCNGAGACPADVFKPSGTACGSAANTVCDNPDTCDGAGNCDVNNEPNTLVCRSDAGECDVAEFCDGAGACPANDFEPSGTACGSGASTDCNNPDTCNGSGSCQANLEPIGTPCGSPSDTVCDNPDTCNAGGTCLVNHEPGTTQCRADAGACDVAEFCDGAGACPANAFEPSGTACGSPSDTVCDNPDTCNASGTCLVNHELGTTQCRADAGACDVAEFCDGAGACPANAFEPSGTACGSPSDTVCDNPDTCDGAGVCDVNYEAATIVCRVDDGDCDIEELCDGAGACPIDVREVDGTPCDDLQFCTVSDQCTAGVCGGALRDCSASGDQCRVGTCNEGTDQCDGPPKLDGTPCNDDDSCTFPDTCAAGDCVGAPDSVGCLDHFSCYKAKTTSGTPKFVGVAGVTLADAFATSTADVRKTKALCAPANSNGTDPTAPSHPDHLQNYQLRPLATFSGGSMTVMDPQGTTTVQLTKATNLLVPTAKSLMSPPVDPVNPIVDHFQCYRVKVTSTTVTFPVTDVTVQDQFGTQTAELLKIKQACVPVNKNNEEPGAGGHSGYLLCYQQRTVPKFVKRTGVFTANQFGNERIDVLKPSLLCMPAVRTL